LFFPPDRDIVPSGKQEDSTMYRTQNDRPDFTRELTVDAVIAGGGVAGVAAALAAGRAGVRTALIQDRPMPGGVSSPECSPGNAVMITGASNYHNRNAREAGIMEELKNTNLYRQQRGCSCVWSQVLQSALEACPAVTLLLNTSVNGVETDGDRITAVRAYGLTTGLHWTIRAKYARKRLSGSYSNLSRPFQNLSIARLVKSPRSCSGT